MSLAKYSSSKRQYQQSPIQDRLEDVDIDPYAPTIVEDLLQGVSEWRNIQDIVRLSFKALTDVVRVHGESLRELERQVASKASKAEVNSGLSLKANTTDVSGTISEIIASLEGKISLDDCQTILRDYVLRSDFQYIVSNKASLDDIKRIIESQVSGSEVRKELNSVNDKMDDLWRETNKKLTNYALQKDFQSLAAQVDQKANLSEMNEQLENKANKQSVSNALHKKANRAEIEVLLSRKVEASDLDKIMDAVDNKLEAAALDRIKLLLENKVDRSDFNLVANSLSNKAEKADVEFANASLSNMRLDNEHRLLDLEKKIELYRSDLEHFEELVNNVDKKADSRDVERLVQLVSKKSDFDHVSNSLNKLRNELSEDIKYVRDEVHQFKRQVGEEIGEKQGKSKSFYERVNDDIHRLSDQVKSILQERRHDLEETTNMAKTISNNAKKELQLTTDTLAEDIERLRRELEEILSKKVDKKEFSHTKSKLQSLIEGKADIAEIQNTIDSWQSDINLRFKENKEEIKSILKEQENELYDIMNKKANLSDLTGALSTKVDMNVLNSLLHKKADFQDFDSLRQKFNKMIQTVDDTVPAKEFDELAHKCIKGLEEIQKEVTQKANISDICTLLDAKASIDDVNRALVDIHKELDAKPNSEELVSFTKEQQVINESLCTENIAARWAWKSGELRSGSMVPWEIQLSNTLPDNFLWEKDKANVLTVAPGLYEITFGFFAKKKPTVQLLVNGEPVMSAVNTASYIIHHSSSGKAKDVSLNKHSSGNITGLTVVDFVVLPARARISIAYSGEADGEGFLGLKRL